MEVIEYVTEEAARAQHDMRQCARYGDRFYTRIVDATDETTWMQPDQEPVC